MSAAIAQHAPVPECTDIAEAKVLLEEAAKIHYRVRELEYTFVRRTDDPQIVVEEVFWQEADPIEFPTPPPAAAE